MRTRKIKDSCGDLITVGKPPCGNLCFLKYTETETTETKTEVRVLTAILNAKQARKVIAALSAAVDEMDKEKGK